MSNLTFDEPSHTYRLDGEPVLSVTQILGACGLADYSRIPPAILELARQEGKAIHSLVELDTKGTLDVDALPAWMRPVLAGWQKFKAASGFSPILSEWKGAHPTLKFAGTLDLLCELPDLKGWKGVALLDVKRSLFAGPVIGYQTAAYKMIVESDKALPRIARRGALRLGPDGRFMLEAFDKPTDASMFLGCLTYLRARAECGLT